jgi:hypothetical protein
LILEMKMIEVKLKIEEMNQQEEDMDELRLA